MRGRPTLDTVGRQGMERRPKIVARRRWQEPQGWEDAFIRQQPYGETERYTTSCGHRHV